MLRSLLLGAAAMLGAAGFARAEDDACGPIVRAVQSIDATRNVHSKMLATDPWRRRPFESEQVILGDIVWATAEGGRWMKLKVSTTDRASLSSGLVRYPPHDCAALPSEQVGGIPMRVYTYNQTVPGPGAVANLLWVGEQDGLPHVYEGRAGEVKTRVTFTYTGVTAPIAE